MTPSSTSSSKAFTLVELLAVVVILGLLMAFVIPAVMRSITSAEVTKVRREVADLEAGIRNYMIHYGAFPHGNGGSGDAVYGIGSGTATTANTWIINNLTGTNTAANVQGINGNPGMNNPDRVRFVELDETRYNAKDNYLDPWGQPYYIVVDSNGDNSLRIPLQNGGGTITVKKRQIAVWSEGDPSETPRKRIVSWE